MMARSWIMPITGIYLIAFAAPLAVMFYRARRARQQRQRQAATALGLPSAPPIPSLPAVLPSYLFDNSEPRPADGDKPLTWCPTCWIRDVTRIGAAYALPAGAPRFCILHAHMTLDRALRARAQEQEQERQQNNQQQTGDKAL